jgi:hypothetical protein
MTTIDVESWEKFDDRLNEVRQSEISAGRNAEFLSWPKLTARGNSKLLSKKAPAHENRCAKRRYNAFLPDS